MRKEKGFEVLDRINLYVAENEMLEKVIEKYKIMDFYQIVMMKKFVVILMEQLLTGL